MALLIGGHIGSGKSVLLRLCNTHSDIVITDEFRNFHRIDLPYLQHVRILKFGWCYLSYRNRKRLAFILFYLFLIWLRALPKRRVSISDVEAVLKRIFPRASIVGDAYAPYVLDLDKTVNVPNLKHAIIYRDCRDVAAIISTRLKSVWKGHNYDPTRLKWMQEIATAKKVAYSWLHYIQIMEKHRDSVYMIRYEDLVADPQGVLTQFGRWLGVDPHQFHYDFIHTNSIGDYKRVLSEQDLADIRAVAGPTMERLGYL